MFNSTQQIAKANNINVWYEAFGQKKDPALLLIMGGFSQGILWPTEFCEQLAKKGFYVIRYDHRDTGLSSCFDFIKKPYNLLDMAKDAIGLLDHLNIEKAHICGLSMGGPIGELMSVHFPKRVSTLTLIATSCDLRPCSLAFDELDSTGINLSRPKQIYIDWMLKFLKSPPQSKEEQLQQRVECWTILNGPVVPFEEQRYRQIHQEFLERLKHPESLTNHLLAIKNSFKMILEVSQQVVVPTLIIHGSEDPILQLDHGEALHKAITHSRFLFVQGLGHVLNCHFYDLIIKEIKQNASQEQSTANFCLKS